MFLCSVSVSCRQGRSVSVSLYPGCRGVNVKMCLYPGIVDIEAYLCIPDGRLYVFLYLCIVNIQYRCKRFYVSVSWM